MAQHESREGAAGAADPGARGDACPGLLDGAGGERAGGVHPPAAQLHLDHGAAADVLRPTARGTRVLLTLLGRSPKAFFDRDRTVLLFGYLAPG